MSTEINNAKKRWKKVVFATTQTSRKICESNHLIYKYKELLKQSVPDKMKTIQNKRLCVNCFNSGHYAKKCRSTTFKKCIIVTTRCCTGKLSRNRVRSSHVKNSIDLSLKKSLRFNIQHGNVSTYFQLSVLYGIEFLAKVLLDFIYTYMINDLYTAIYIFVKLFVCL